MIVFRLHYSHFSLVDRVGWKYYFKVSNFGEQFQIRVMCGVRVRCWIRWLVLESRFIFETAHPRFDTHFNNPRFYVYQDVYAVQKMVRTYKSLSSTRLDLVRLLIQVKCS